MPFNRELLREFADALASGDKRRAFELSEELISAIDYKLGEKPEAVGFFSRATLIYYELGEFEKAIADLDSAIELQNNYADAYLIRGKCYHRLGKHKRAIDDFTSEISNHPDNGEAFYNRGCLYLEQGQYEKALDDFSRAIAIDPEYGEAFGNRGNVHHAMGNERLAIDDHSTAITLEPDYALNYFNRGNEYFALKEFHCAIKDYSKAIDLGYADAKLGRALAYKEAGRFKSAIEDLSQLIQTNPKPAFYRYRAECYASSGKPKQAAVDMGSMMNSMKGLVQEIQNAVRKGDLNDALLQTISTAGGSVSSSSVIDHFIYCPGGSVEELSKRLRDLGFDVDKPDDEVDEDSGHVCVPFHETARPDEMEKRTVELERLAAEYSGTYDGWGTSLS